MTHFLRFPLLVLFGSSLVVACGDAERQARDQYMGLCDDYRQSCACQFDLLRAELSEDQFVELVGHLTVLAADNAEAGGTASGIRLMPGSEQVRQTYFKAALACTRDTAF